MTLPPVLATTWVVIEYLIKIAALGTVPENRRPSSSTAWLLLIFLLPLVGLPLYLLIGSPWVHGTRRRQQHTVNEITLDYTRSMPDLPKGARPSTYLAGALRMNRRLTGLPCVSGEVVAVHADPRSTYEAMARAIDSATDHVHVEFYIMSWDEVTDVFFAALERAVARGVTVRLLLDHLGSRKYPGWKQFCQRMTDAGIRWRLMMPLLPLKRRWRRPDLRNHRKILVIDGEKAFIGSHNVIDPSYRTRRNVRAGRRWEDLSVEVTGEIVLEAQAVFAMDWYFEAGEQLEAFDLALGTPLETLPEMAGLPGILVGTQVQLPRAGTHELYILYSLSADQAQVDVVLRVLAFSALPIVVALPIGVFALLHRLLLPVRLTAQAATKASEGDLDVRVEVRGDDEMAGLGRAFNAMTSSLQDTIARYDELAKLQQRFVSDVSHELRTPLTTIRMAEDVVWDNRDDLPAHARRSAELLHDQTERMEQMLADLLEISRYDAASALLDAEERDLRPIVARVVAGCADLARRQGVRVETLAPTRASAEIDERRIERVIRNLVVNAIEHADGSTVTITVAASATDVACRVRDRGVGMTPQVVAHVFDRFYRADTARARTTGGTGLGLAIATEDVEIHGGRLQAWGEPGRGASFLMTLPRHAGDEIASRPLALWEEE